VAGGETVEVDIPELPVEAAPEAEAIAINVVHEDDWLLVIDKPAGLVVHPGAGNRAGTLVNALLHRDPRLAALPRAGIVHRLDKETSGLMVVARDEATRLALVDALAARRVRRTYLALVLGPVIAGATIDAPIGRHPRDRLRMAVTGRGRAARTHYRVLERFDHYTLLRVQLESGRTHQIRVHFAHVDHPLVGDPLYGGRARSPAGCSAQLATALRAFGRQALHATELALQHPATGQSMRWSSPLPADIEHLLSLLRADAGTAGDVR
jgi:23S rRNA pseudouridine1911/1915/1917 synthase